MGESMNDPGDLRPNEEAVALEPASDATLRFIGTIRTPWRDRKDCPRQGNTEGPECELVLDPVWHEGLKGLEDYDTIEVLYWLDQSRRDLIRQSPRSDGQTFGTFALLSMFRRPLLHFTRSAIARASGRTPATPEDT